MIINIKLGNHAATNGGSTPATPYDTLICWNKI